MKINNFNKTGIQKINELNAYPKENPELKCGFHPKSKTRKSQRAGGYACYYFKKLQQTI